MAILVTGGAGYIGSHTAAALLERGEEVVVLDNLQTGHRRAAEGCIFHEGDIRDAEVLDRIFETHDIDAVIHFAANSLVAESMADPGRYYHNNVYGTLCLLERMRAHGVKRLVFSSTAAVYGEPERVPIGETDRTEPTNAYGETKLAMERMIRWFGAAHGIESVSLRYFNAAGAHESGRIGEDHDPETHLVPIVLQAALGKRPHVAIFGDDYPTPDGTCIRDYIHVSDLADAHLLALDRLRRGEGSAVYNLGSGRGFSVREIIDQARRVTGRDIPVIVQPRRAGDPAVLVASPERAKRELGWQPRRSDIETIIRTAWAWHSAHPDGYGDR
ncbi:MAG: UDP-glucose 4-epimerase GalE [Thermobacillus sp. ZCTH02-B1]|uniref:UDP-glucose 4-epimerase GalE n=1 Tax=Thermobacillus sp. ZCTH02-B1 TaxID=1858795 RepID=UPI000B56424D|nr:UDP-glucose 4-epimerase GalE [Thermobacillus sp. ZCTH02-B1]OUM95316.1 MAG: UDP-glucose 4-epimerase GalE [Thermobacillus sp. ZCTH02-B1]